MANVEAVVPMLIVAGVACFVAAILVIAWRASR